VIEALRAADQDRKCYRMIGGVLVEQTVKKVLPDLTVNADQVLLRSFFKSNQIIDF